MAAEAGDEACVLAGGTDLLVQIPKGRRAPTIVIDLKHVADLGGDVTETDSGFRIGALMPMTDIMAHDGIVRHFPALCQAVRVIGSVQIRNRATLAGNICNASPAADSVPPLLVYGATVNAAGRAGERSIPLREFFLGPGRTCLAAGELAVSIDLPTPPARGGAAFERLTRRRGMDLASVSAACAVQPSGALGFGFGAVGPTPIFVGLDAPGVLDADNRAARNDAVEDAAAAARPIGDIRAGEAYRRAMVPVLARRALVRALEQIWKETP